ncbi:mucin-4 isoform X2 [Pimephales promelas]|uniref:mucin-4 isoform X2 n=1 Tax=Pimephales promelas TaxID=90988 RepID=UPI00195583F3|nr:mucin-4 isoform X2 [Pimephales promelas]
MPEGAGRDSQKKNNNQAAKRPSSVSSLSGIVSRMASSGGASRGSCTSVNTVCSDSDRGASLSSSASSASLQDGHSSSSSSSLPYGAMPVYPGPQRNGSDISLDLTPLSLLTGASPLPASSTPLHKLTRLERVALEIVETEQAYVRDLKSIVEDYLGCIIDCGDLPLKPEEVSTLFCNIEDIYEFNSELLEDLERSPHATAIAECFVERSEAFDIYTIYCMNYPNSVTVLRDCMKNESLVRFFQERQATLCHSLPLETYLLKPVQRILKYHLLLQELSKHFDKSDPGYEVVEEAIITMTAVAWYINDMKRKQEHAVRLQEIESLLLNWTGPDLSGFGELVLEGSFRVQRVKKERAFFLFDKMLLIAKKRLDHFIYSTHIFCCNLLLVENMKDPLCFKVSDQTIPKQQHIVQAKNQEEKRLWLHYLKRMIVENHPASLPQKARQVLGDNFCQSPQFDQEPIRKPMPSPRLDDVHNYHRGRRQSEPPEFIYTPEKARKCLPLLLEGNLPYKRGRRQSAPAKDIEAAFQQSGSLKAGSEGELCPQADSMGSSGSTSTLASSVIEVESGHDDLVLCQDEDDMTPLSPPPTLSITEEIMQFINQSRARQGMAELTSEVCQLTPESLEVKPLEAQQSDESKPLLSEVDDNKHQMDNNISEADNKLVDGSDKDENSYPSCEANVASLEELERASSPLHISKEVNQSEELTLPEPSHSESSKPEMEKTISEKGGKYTEDSVSKSEEPHLSDNLDKTDDTACEASSACAHIASTLTTTDISLVPNVEPEQKLTKSDKQIIEKIRSYYEAAEAGVEEGQMARRNSFSNIPTGLVKDSVSRFNVFVHQDSLVESESGHSDCVETDLASSLLPISDQADQCGQTIESDQTFKHQESALSHSDIIQEQKEELDGKTAEQKDVEILHSTENPSVEFSPCMKLWKEKERIDQESQNNLKVPLSRENSCVEHTDASEKNKISINCSTPLLQHKQNEGSQSQSDTSDPSNLQITETADTSLQYGGRTRARMSSNGSLDSLPSQIKVGRWSRHGKVVTCSHTLYEGMAEVPDLGFFEGGPVNQCLVENSEKILNKVQMLARMYTAKASSMKVPLHQKKTRVSRGAWLVEGKGSTSPKSQKVQLHRGDMRILSQPAEESSVSTSTEAFGHIILREKLSTMYHQENDCNLIGPPDEISTIGSDSLSFSSAESSATSVEILTTVMESQVSVISDHRESSLERSESKQHEGAQSLLLSTSGPHVQEMPSNLSEFPLNEHAYNISQSIQENYSNVGDKFIAINGIEEGQILQEENPAFVSNSGPSSQHFTDPLVIKNLEEETHSVDEKSASIVQCCERILTIDGQQDEMHTGHLKSKQVQDDTETTSLEKMTPVATSVNKVVACPPLQQADFLKNCEQSCPLAQLQEDTTIPTLSTCSKCSPLDVKSKEDLSNNSKSYSPPATPPLGGPSFDELPRFTSQRPSNLPSTAGKRSTFANWNSSSVDQRVPHSSLRTEEQIQGTSDFGLSHNRQSLFHTVNDKPLNIPFGFGRPLDAKPPSAFSPNLRMRSPSPIRGAQNSRPSSTASALAKSLAASCISQTISQNMAKRGAHLQTASPTVSSSSLPTSSVRLRSPSPKSITLDLSVESGCRSTSSTGVGNPQGQPPRSSSSPCRSNSLRSSPATVQTPPPFRSQRSISPAPPVSLHSTPSANSPSSAALEQPPYTSLNSNNNNNNNNNSLSNNGWATNHKKAPHSNVGGLPHFHDPQRTTLHNRVARPFPSSEPSSRVQSPSISPSPITRICSPPPTPNHSSNLVTKPPNPRAPRQGGFFTPLSLDISRSTSACSLSPCGSPRITSPPPIGIPTSVWGFANPQPRNPSLTNTYSPTKVETNSPPKGTRIISPTPMGMSPCSATISQSQRRLRGNSLPFVALGDRPPSPKRQERRSWAESGRWSVGSELGLVSPRGGSYSGSPSSTSPGPLSPVRLTAERTSHNGKHLTNIAWPDVHDQLIKYNTEPNTETNTLSYSEAELDDIEVAESTCRSTLICPYVAPVSPNDRETPIHCPDAGKTEDSVINQGSKTTLKTSYATTVNLQIAGSGRIASFSNAQVSLTQTLSPVADSQGRRRVSINSCNFSMQNCKRL